MSNTAPKYHIGKEYPSKSITLAWIYSVVFYVGAGFACAMMLIAILSPHSFVADTPNLLGGLVVVGVLLTIAIGFNVLHGSRPPAQIHRTRYLL